MRLRGFRGLRLVEFNQGSRHFGIQGFSFLGLGGFDRV